MSAAAQPRLTRAQQALLLEHTAWRNRMTRRLLRRFGKWVSEEEIQEIILFKSMECAARWEEGRGVPFPAYALKHITYSVLDRATQAKDHLEMAYRACSSCAELWLSDPKVVYGTDEERRNEVGRLAGQAAAAMVLAGAFSRGTAEGGEDALIEAVDGQRVLAAIDTLEARMREILHRRYREGQELLETTAQEMGIGVITVRRAHSAALDELRDRFV